jgi:O-antigen/teichoic acid export membrane protein
MAGLLKLVSFVTAGLGAFYIVLALMVPVMVPIFLGDAYRGAITALQITALGLVFAAAAALVTSLMQGVGLKHFVAGTAVFTTVTCLVCVAIGGFFWGANGAAGGLALSYFLQSVMLTFRLASFIVRKEPNR